jgi:hypothetical protein
MYFHEDFIILSKRLDQTVAKFRISFTTPFPSDPLSTAHLTSPLSSDLFPDESPVIDPLGPVPP